MGEGFANIVMLALMALVAFVLDEALVALVLVTPCSAPEATGAETAPSRLLSAAANSA